MGSWCDGLKRAIHGLIHFAAARCIVLAHFIAARHLRIRKEKKRPRRFAFRDLLYDLVGVRLGASTGDKGLGFGGIASGDDKDHDEY